MGVCLCDVKTQGQVSHPLALVSPLSDLSFLPFCCPPQVPNYNPKDVVDNIK